MGSSRGLFLARRSANCNSDNKYPPRAKALLLFGAVFEQPEMGRTICRDEEGLETHLKGRKAVSGCLPLDQGPTSLSHPIFGNTDYE